MREDYQYGRDLNCQIKDLDIIYYKADNLSVDADIKYYEMI